MPLHFSRLKDEIEYFENADSISVESMLDLMSDLYSDIADSLECKPEACDNDDTDALTANLIWLGTLFRKISDAHSGDIALSGNATAVRLDSMTRNLTGEINTLNNSLEDMENRTRRAAALQKEKQRLEGELVRRKQTDVDLNGLEQEVGKLNEQKTAAEQALANAQSDWQFLTAQIQDISNKTDEIRRTISQELQPLLRQRKADKEEKEQELERIHDTITDMDDSITVLTDQIHNLRRVLEESDKNQIAANLALQKEHLRKQIAAVEHAIRRNEEIEIEIEERQSQWEKHSAALAKKVQERERLDDELQKLEEQFAFLSAGEEQYLRKKIRFHTLKTTAEQLRQDSACLCSRTGQIPFRLEDELNCAMEAINGYLGRICDAIRQYTEQTQTRM